jgi:hypothetical protein
MTKSLSLSKTFLACLALLVGANAGAADFEWSGTYRVEGNHIKNSELNGSRQLDYGLHHLSLRPKIVAGDGITIFGQFELFNSNSYPNSQLGQVFGSGVNTSKPYAAGTTADDSSGLSGVQRSEAILISHLYLSWVQEYGALLAGRAPLHFGLGMSYNAGKGLFDHWFDTRDLVAYKIMMGNLSLTPMYGKVHEGDLDRAEDINDFMVNLMYENPESDLEMGVHYRVRKSGDTGSDVPKDSATNPVGIGGNNSVNAAIDMNELNVYAAKDTDRWRAAVEAAFLSGKIGVATAAAEDVTMNGFGIASEFEYRPEGSRWKYGLKAGYASGDDPETDSQYEGYIFDRNYDVAMLLFNRPLGRQDVLRTGAYGGGPNATTGLQDKPDVEAISNVMYAVPYFDYQWTDKFSVQGALALGWLNVDPQLVDDVGSDLGYEVDLGLSFSPRKGVVWKNEIGMLFPGSAFDFNGEGPGFAYGYTSRAAISF